MCRAVQSTVGVGKELEGLKQRNGSCWDSPVVQQQRIPCNAGETGSSSGLGRSPGEGNGNPLHLPGKSHGQRRLADYRPWGCKRVRHDFVSNQQWITLAILLKIVYRETRGQQGGETRQDHGSQIIHSNTMQNLSKHTGVPPDVKFVIFNFCFFFNTVASVRHPMKYELEVVHSFDIKVLCHIVAMSYLCKAFAVIKSKYCVKISVKQERRKVVSNLLTRLEKLCGFLFILS